ncbi:MAG: sulfotransferase [Bacteroidetes bacterium]|nr:sulfotransferase [Bacteroidota bacterium]
MSFKKSKIEPIIIIGMHRSGTTMITEFLDQLGLFVGAKLDPNHESLFFFDLNKWIFDVGIAKVDYPQNLELMNPNCKEEVIKVIDYHLSSSRRKKYLGPHKVNDIRDLDIPWGWKEPRNSFTLEFYKVLFPNAKIIHIYRNPIDSTNSYLKRDRKRRNEFELTWKKKLKRKFLIADKYHQNFRLNTLQDGYDLWKEYVSKAFSWEAEYGDRMLTLKYENFLDNPADRIKMLADFCGLKTTEAKIKELVKDVDSSRKYAFTNDEKSVDFYHRIQQEEWMTRLGYDDILGNS